MRRIVTSAAQLTPGSLNKALSAIFVSGAMQMGSGTDLSNIIRMPGGKGVLWSGAPMFRSFTSNL